MIKKILFLFVICFHIVFGSLQANDDWVNLIVESADPKGHIWTRQGSGGRIDSFEEYYLSSVDQACGFRAFGYNSRHEAIQDVENVLKDQNNPDYKHVLKFMSNEIRADNPDNSSPSLEQQLNYLTLFKQSKEELSFSPTYQENGTKEKAFYTLINALAVIKKVHLFIYKPCMDEKGGTTPNLSAEKMYLSHSFYQKGKDAFKKLHLIHKHGHFNLLIPVKDDARRNFLTKEEARTQQINHLNELRQRTIKDHSCNNDTSSSSLDAADIVMDIPASEEDAAMAVAVSSENNSQEDIASIHLSEDPVFSEVDLLTFVKNFYVQTLPGLTKEESCQQVYNHFRQETSSQSAFALSRLTLDKDFVPEGQTKEAFLDDVIKRLEAIDSGNREKHYAQIFKGKLLIKLNRFDDAYAVLNALKTKDEKRKHAPYTRTYLVDFAELIIEHDYVPEDITQEDALSLAKNILEQLDLSRQDNRSTRAQRRGSNNDLLTGQELNRVEVQERIGRMRGVNTKQRSRSSSRSTGAPKPIFVQERPTQTRIGDMLEDREDDTDSGLDSDDSEITLSSRATSPSSPMMMDDDLSEAEDIEAEDENHEDRNLHDDWVSNEAISKCKEYLFLGKYYGKLKRDDEAAGYYKKSLDLALKVDNLSLQAQAYIGLGNATGGEIAINYFNQALHFAQGAQDKTLQAQAYIGLGNRIRDEVAIAHFNQAFDLASQVESPKLQAQACIGLGNATRDKIAIHHFNQASRFAQEAQDETFQIKALIGLGNARDGFDAGIVRYQEALSLARKIKSPELQAQAYIGLGNASRGEIAINYFNQALHFAQGAQDKTLQAQAYIGLGNVTGLTGGEIAINHFNQALHFAQEAQNETVQAQAYIGLGNVTRDEVAIAHFNQAFDLASQVQSPKLQAQAYIGLGNATRELIRIDYFNKALHFASQVQSPKLQAQAYIGLGNATRDEIAIKHYNQALYFAQEAQDKPLQAQAYIGLGNVTRDEVAIDHFNQAFRFAQEAKDQTLEAQACIGLGNASNRANPIERLAHYDRALVLLGATNDPSRRVQALISRSACLSKLKRFPEALSGIEEALRIAPSPELKHKAEQAKGNIQMFCDRLKNAGSNRSSSRNVLNPLRTAPTGVFIGKAARSSQKPFFKCRDFDRN